MKDGILSALPLLCALGARAEPPGLLPTSPAWVSISSEDLQQRYDTLWAVSDVHGEREQLEKLLLAAGLAVRHGGGMDWKPGHARQLFLVLGDSVRGGPDSRGVVLLLKKLQDQSAAEGSRVVVLLGNHEVRFLASPFRRGEDEFSRFIRTMPIAAFVGSWLFAHAGYIDARDKVDDLREYFAQAGDSWSRGEYGFLLRPNSILEYHDWWKSQRRRSKMKDRLETLGLNGLVFGHDPYALGAPGTIAMDADGWFMKLDTGLKESASAGMFLRCEIARLARGTKLAMSENGKPICRALAPDGSLRDIRVH
ncbi:MAG TPA: metallophosphoesterase [Myxococcales bacterium]